MSAGTFTIRVYEGDSGEKHLIKQQPESANFSIGGSPNTIPAGPATSPFWAETTRGATQYGLRPRKLRGRWNSGAEPAGYADCATFTVVVYSKSVYDSATLGESCTYLGAAGTLIGRVSEDIYPAV